MKLGFAAFLRAHDRANFRVFEALTSLSSAPLYPTYGNPIFRGRGNHFKIPLKNVNKK